MLKFQAIKLLALSLTLLTIPCMAQDVSDFAADNDVIEQSVLRSKSKSHRIKPLKLADFAGEWTINQQSVGGLSGGIGASETADGQVSFDRNGNGTVNFLSLSRYTGIPGDVEVGTVVPPLQLVITITITDSVHGIGTLTITDPAVNSIVDTADFVAIRSKSDGKVRRLNGHATHTFADQKSIGTYSLERQYE